MSTLSPIRLNGIPAELSAWQAELRRDFPLLAGSPDMVYLDSAATAQKPLAVLEAVHDYLTSRNANAGRGTYRWANETTAMVQRAADRVRSFLDDPHPDSSQVQLVSGTTEGLRRIALEWLPGWLEDGDEIIVPHGDHQANLVPWLDARKQLARCGVNIVVRPMPYESASGEYDPAALEALTGPRTRFVAATHVHHVYGGNMNVHRLRGVVGPDVPICLDAAQSVGHIPVSVSELDVDFVVFSGHKAMALPGSGAVWARNTRGPAFCPAGWQGSPNTTGALSLISALDWLDAAGVEAIGRWTTWLGALLTEALDRLPSYTVLGCQDSLGWDSPVQRRHGIVAFRHREIGANDLGFILASRNLMVRADSHCQAGAREAESSVRVSMHVYNTPEEVDRLIQVLEELDPER